MISKSLKYLGILRQRKSTVSSEIGLFVNTIYLALTIMFLNPCLFSVYRAQAGQQCIAVLKNR